MKTSREEAKNLGFPVFNNGEHVCIDMSNLKSGETQTVSIKGPSGVNLTLSFVGRSFGTVADIKYHGEDNCKMIALNSSGSDIIAHNAEIYSLDITKK